MSARVAVLIAVPFAVLAFVLRLGGVLWWQPVTWRLGMVPGMLAFLGAFAASIGIPLAAYLLATRAARRKPATWQLDTTNRRFFAPVSPASAGPRAILLGWIAGAAIPTERMPGHNAMRIAHLGVVTTIGTVVSALLLLAAMLILLLNRPSLSLDPCGLTLYRLVGRTSIPWTNLVPSGPRVPGERNPAALKLLLRRPGEAPPQQHRLPVRALHIDTAYLATTIRHYTSDASHRPSIGTVEELAALKPNSGS
ncbi:hypothetical protein [Actinoplanes sp. NPDC049265]|uniref:hypothetical protein n=1 Tax=Actinoplanes sp. NPDC049265 TaxID=3363902 RepID=UPI00371781CA